AVRWTLLGHTRKAISKKLGIAHQKLTKRLLAAGWRYLEHPFQFMHGLLLETSGTLKRVQWANASPQRCNELMLIFLQLYAAHLIADFILQPKWIVLNKRKPLALL